MGGRVRTGESMTKSDQPSHGPAGAPPSREDRLAKALRENLKRRKAASAPPPAPSKDRD
jgi:hypothetical protein